MSRALLFRLKSTSPVESIITTHPTILQVMARAKEGEGKESTEHGSSVLQVVPLFQSVHQIHCLSQLAPSRTSDIFRIYIRVIILLCFFFIFEYSVKVGRSRSRLEAWLSASHSLDFSCRSVLQEGKVALALIIYFYGETSYFNIELSISLIIGICPLCSWQARATTLYLNEYPHVRTPGPLHRISAYARVINRSASKEDESKKSVIYLVTFDFPIRQCM